MPDVFYVLYAVAFCVLGVALTDYAFGSTVRRDVIAAIRRRLPQASGTDPADAAPIAPISVEPLPADPPADRPVDPASEPVTVDAEVVAEDVDGNPTRPFLRSETLRAIAGPGSPALFTPTGGSRTVDMDRAEPAPAPEPAPEPARANLPVLAGARIGDALDVLYDPWKDHAGDTGAFTPWNLDGDPECAS